MARFVVLKIHFPLVRPQTSSRWDDCLAKVDERAAANPDVPVFLLTDHNDHSGKRFKPKGFKRIGGKGIDYIGVKLPRGAKYRVLDVGVAVGTIDNHDFYGTQVELAYADGAKETFWLVQSNLGRGEPASVFVANLKRIKAKFRGKAVYGFDEIDEADRPDEHEELRAEFPNVADDKIAGWGTYSPTVIRGAALDLVRVHIFKACDGLAKVTPARVLVESTVEV